MAVRPFDEIFRDFVINGLPASGLHHPEKKDIRDSLNALVAGPFPDNRVIKLNNANEGTENNIVVSASVAIPTAVYQVLYILNVTQENTGPVTISGAINRKLVTNTSEPVPAGYLKPGMAVLCIDTGSELRMLSYGDVEKAVEDLVSRAEAAEAAAELAKDQAQNAASDAVSQGNVPIYSTRNAVETLEIPAGINAFRTNGFASIGDGGAALYKKVDTEPSHAGKVQSADGAWWEEVKRDGSRAFWMTQRVPFAVAAVRTTGYNSEGDLGDALYKRVDYDPPHEGKFRTADGIWWELVETDIRAAVFGAFPNTDATWQLQDALTYLRLKGGGHLYVNKGVYETRYPLQIGSNTTFQMDPDAVIRRMSNIDCMILSYSDGTQGGYNASKDITIEGGTWDHNGIAYPTPGSAIAFGHCTRPTVRRVTVLDVSGRWHAIECNASTQALFEFNIFDGGGNDDGGGECIQIDGAYAGGAFPWYGPLDNTTCYDVTIRHNVIRNWASGIGSHSVVGTNRHEDIKIYNNEIICSRYCIAVFNWAGVQIKGNRLIGLMDGQGGQQFGIFVQNSGNAMSDIVISDNTFLNFRRDTSVPSGSRAIFLFGDLGNQGLFRNIRITGNYIQSVGRHAITLEGCSAYVVENNIITAIDGRGVYVYGSSHGFVRSNRISSTHSDPAIDVTGAGTTQSSSNVITDNIVTGANGGIRIASTAPNSVAVNNITPVLTKTGATGILGPNWVNGALVA